MIQNYYRGVKPLPHFFKDGRISSAVFRDSRGVSVDNQGKRKHEAVVEVFKTMPAEPPYVKLAVVNNEMCNEKDIFIKNDPIPNNRYHCLLLKNQKEIELTQSQRKHLAKKCTTYTIRISQIN